MSCQTNNTFLPTGGPGIQGLPGIDGAGYGDVSTTTNTITTGSKTFTIATGKAYNTASRVKIMNDITHYMVGNVTSYNSVTGQLIVNVDEIIGYGGGSLSSWTISLSSESFNGTIIYKAQKKLSVAEVSTLGSAPVVLSTNTSEGSIFNIIAAETLIVDGDTPYTHNLSSTVVLINSGVSGAEPQLQCDCLSINVDGGGCEGAAKKFKEVDETLCNFSDENLQGQASGPNILITTADGLDPAGPGDFAMWITAYYVLTTFN